jgi:choline/glycine/proline betaine transport protein
LEGSASWRRRLGAIVSHPSKEQVVAHIETTVARAFTAVVAELGKRELAADTERVDDGLQLTVRHGEGTADFVYSVRPVSHPIPAFALTDAARREGEQHRYYRAEVFLMQGSRGYDIFGYHAEQVIADVINHYDRFRHYLYATSEG